MEAVLSHQIYVNYLSECNNNFYLHFKELISRQKYILYVVDVLSGICKAKKRFGLSHVEFEKALIQKSWRPELLYLISLSKLIDLNKYFSFKDNNTTDCNNLCEDLLFLFFKSADDPFYIEVKNELATAILNYAKADSLDKTFIPFFAQLYYNSIKNYEIVDNSTALPFLSCITPETHGNEPLLSLILSHVFTDKGSNIMDAFKCASYMKPGDNKALSAVFDYLNKLITPSDALKNFLTECDQETNINWSTIGQFLRSVANFVEIKKLIIEFVERGLEESKSYQLYTALILGRIISLQPQVTSYMQWFSSTFSSESSRPLNTDVKAKFFLKCLTDIIYYEDVGHLKAHVNKVPFVPSTCQVELSEYVQIAKSCLTSMNASIELGFFEGVDGMKTADGDVKCLIESFEKKKKLPLAFLSSLQFRRQYFERELLPKLLSLCPGRNSTHHSVIKELHSLGKISNAVFNQHKEECGF